MHEHLFAMAYPPYLREKARRLRTERKMSLIEISERLALGKTTVWYWIKDLPDPEIKYRQTPGRTAAREAHARRMRDHYRALREEAYEEGLLQYLHLVRDPTFRDFVCMYIGEGYKRSRNSVALANSDPRVVKLANKWITALSRGKVTYSFQYHADQNPDQLIAFWADHLGADPSAFTYQRKSNSGQLTGRTWRSRYGVLTVRAQDTYLRCRLQAWMDWVQDEWL
jgi:hypothetical protein